MNDQEILVEFREVEFRPPNSPKPIVTNLNLIVRRGETLVLLGESGCGKTTTLRLINRMLLPTAGEVVVDGQLTSEWNPIQLRRRTGYVIQESGLFPHFTVEKNVSLVPHLEKWEDSKARARAHEMLKLVGLEPEVYATRFPHQLSGGQRQRVGVARALAADPPLLLLDEPFGALDPLTRAALQQEFISLRERLGKTSVFITHDLREALLVATRIGLMRAGRLLLMETPSNFLQSNDSYARAYRDTLGLEALPLVHSN